jgi:hypothetical protein
MQAVINTLTDLNNISPDMHIVTFIDTFNVSISNVFWPESIRVVQFGYLFNRDICNVIWPKLLHTLIFGGLFDQEIQNMYWPNDICKLKFGWSFNRINLKWPDSLRELILLNILGIGNNFNYNTNKFIFPSELNILKIFSAPINAINYDWPKKLRILYISIYHEFLNWPETLTALHLNIYNDNLDICDMKWPILLNTLEIGGEYNRDIYAIPEINVLILSQLFNCNIDKVHFPHTLHEITFGHKFNQDISQVIFYELYIIHDYSCIITINSCKFPKSLHKIIYYHTDWFSDNNGNILYNPKIHYERKIGQFTKMANK